MAVAVAGRRGTRTRGCWCSTSRWPPSSASTRRGCAAPTGVRLLVGAEVPDGATPVAQAYAGHQFGGYSPRLGDGRALLLGELVDADGRLRDLHLKGSGRTPFARGGDGLAAVGPMLREYVDQRGDARPGHPDHAVAGRRRDRGRRCGARRCCPVPCWPASRAATCGSAASSTPAATGDLDLVRRLADHAIARHYPAAADAEQPYLALFDAVVAAQAALVARWMLRRLHPRGDEHRQHDDLGRDHRLRAVRLHGGLRPGDGVQLDRPRGAATPTPTSRSSRSGTWPASPRRCCR